MKIRRIFIVSTLIITLFSLYLYIGGWPIVLNNNKTQMLKFSNFNNLMFNPLNNIDFSSGENKVFLVFSLDDINELPGKIIKRKVLVCSDNEVLKLLKNNFTFNNSWNDCFL